MALTVTSAFDQFMSETVNLDRKKTENARASRDWLFGQLESFQADTTFPKSYDEHDIAYGSFARGTKTRPLDDIDLMICLHGQGGRYDSYLDRIQITVNPTTNLKPLCYDNSDTLNSTKVINKFIQKLAAVPQYANSGLKKNGSAAVLSLNSYDWCFDIVPCFMTAPEMDGRTYYLIPNGSGDWKKTDPRIDRDRVTTINKAHDGNVLDVIRATKYWNKRPTMPSIPSYLLEAIALDYYDRHSGTASSYVDIELPDLFGHISTAVWDIVWDPKRIQGDINTLSYDAKVKIAERAKRDQQKATEARRLENDGNHQSSINRWREIFGGDFPIYG